MDAFQTCARDPIDFKCRVCRARVLLQVFLFGLAEVQRFQGKILKLATVLRLGLNGRLFAC